MLKHQISKKYDWYSEDDKCGGWPGAKRRISDGQGDSLRGKNFWNG